MATNYPRPLPEILEDAYSQGISKAKLSRMSGVDYSTLWRLETGVNLPNIKTLQRLEYALAQINNDAGI